ncbi:MAG: hypothetical protein A2015_08455 [Spirochaetes bacterium GWF1_31_7]|nr:MAG: hypothetical protein A2Y30_08650 [Spirochaetes bacterium GWE1_32_154]OHD47177.1 MAG: hypothetical protein A2015_08455 [Spirochaetes bacterium GWF1_31_7]OHD47488.1 MAG: hypothetical protein A2Y29_08875 [Spirochaetes bacterium GWE2_31_10]OHD82322.1 MAG: hypothetical protein A2355_15285 [Spirochaetes bacterium RIFOXYB1_FULL_32_8]HBD92575.1 glyoxalase [Spirochaetia bacterium]
MSINARFVHINIVTENVDRLVVFYQKVFGCKKIGSDRDLKGKWFDEATSIPNAHVQGCHLLMPGYDENGPTIEVFSYKTPYTGNNKLINASGFSHIAFIVDNVDLALDEIIAFGGSRLGETVSTEINGIGNIKFVYAKDPDGNIIELQSWKK